MVIDCLHQRNNLLGYRIFLKRHEVVHLTRPDLPTQVAQGPEGPLHGDPYEQYCKDHHANVAKEAVPPHLLTRLQALVNAFADQYEHLPPRPAVVQIPPDRDEPYLVVSIHGVVEFRHALHFWQARRPWQAWHAH